MTSYNITVGNTSQLLAGVPALLGYLATSRLIVVTTHRPDKTSNAEAIRMTAAVDINLPADAAGHIAQTCHINAQNTARAFLIAVCDESQHQHARTVIDAATQSLLDADVPVAQRLIAESLTGGRWYDIDDDERAGIADYRDSEITATAVLSGRVVAASRDELKAELAETTPAPATLAPGVLDQAHVLALRDELQAVIDGQPTTPDLPTQLAAVICARPSWRDILLVCGSDQPDRAAATWTGIANQLRGAGRIQALIIVAAHRYAGSDAVRAQVALDTADELARQLEVGFPPLGQLLTTALVSGIEPQKIRALLGSLAAHPSGG